MEKQSSATEFPYIHGFSEAEQQRLREQSSFAEFELYRDIDLSNVKQLLEVGCGVGAQSEILLRRFADLHLTGIDFSAEQLGAAQQHLRSLPFSEGRFELQQMDAANLEFASKEFDAAFLCWVLEHVPDPSRVLSEVRRVLKPGGRVYITEVLNSSFFLDPYSPNLAQYWLAFNDYQLEVGGDPFVGAKLGNLLLAQGYRDITTASKTWHLDNRCPDKRKATIEYWTNLLLSACKQLIEAGKVTEDLVEGMKTELRNVKNDPDAVFYYSFVQASARVY